MAARRFCQLPPARSLNFGCHLGVRFSSNTGSSGGPSFSSSKHGLPRSASPKVSQRRRPKRRTPSAPMPFDPRTPIMGQNWMPGDWACPECGTHNPGVSISTFQVPRLNLFCEGSQILSPLRSKNYLRCYRKIQVQTIWCTRFLKNICTIRMNVKTWKCIGCEFVNDVTRSVTSRFS